MLLTVNNLTKSYPTGTGKKLTILKNLDLSVKKGETVAITGYSGSGKSTLLSLLGGLDKPDKGKIQIENTDLGKMKEDDLTRFRAQNIGFVFQQFYLMPHLSALENVSLPLEISGAKNPIKKASELLKKTGLENRKTHYPNELSGGECQRVAIARALVTEPALLLADEPTGNLDTNIGKKISELLFGLVADLQMTMILVTHNSELAKECDRSIHLNNGAFA